jgi:4-alpha-glucanotransferase
MATLEDACAETRRPNMPGAEQHPSWRIALRRPLEKLMRDPLPARIAAVLGKGRPPSSR